MAGAAGPTDRPNPTTTMDDLDLDDLARETGLAVVRDAPLAPFTSLKVGGRADALVRVRSEQELVAAAFHAHARGLPVLVLGGGSNVVVSDHGIPGVVIKVDGSMGGRASGAIVGEREGEVIVAVEAGCATAALARWAARAGLGGVEWACGIPGTIGGAIVGNAGAYGGDMAGIVEVVRAWAPDGQVPLAKGFPPAGRVIEVPVDQMAYGYRTSRMKRPGAGIVLGARLRLRRTDPSALMARIDEFESARRRKQPTERSCGSVFRNPPGDVAGRLLEKAGMKGRTRNDAQVSEVHANWIINRGRAMASDVVALMREGQAAVLDGAGIRLRVEVLLVGAWDRAEVGDLVDPEDAAAHHPGDGGIAGPNHREGGVRGAGELAAPRAHAGRGAEA